jgi:hypothetical protein
LSRKIPGIKAGQSRYVFFPKISTTRLRSKRRTGMFQKGRLSLPRTFQTDFMASVKRSGGFKKTVRRKFQHSVIALSIKGSRLNRHAF